MFSNFIHASYFAMYLILAIIFVLFFYKGWFSAQKSVIYSSYFFVSIFVATIFLCSSKLGIISFFVILPLAWLLKRRTRFNVKTIAVLIFGLLVVLLILKQIFPGSFDRLNSLRSISAHQIDKTSAESTAVRLLIWEQALKLIGENILTGTGVGDANDELYRAYEKNGLSGALRYHLNAHNQFLQTLIGLGLVGLVPLVLITFAQLIKGMLESRNLLLLFSLLIIMNFMVESMLQTSAGVLFFVFFLCFFSLTDESGLADGAEMNPNFNEA